MPHIHELYDFTASAYIVHNNRILLLKHILFHRWLQPGGHIELNEHPEEALWREIKEETGLTKDDLKLIKTGPSIPRSSDAVTLPQPFDINVHPIDNKHQHIDLAYIMVSKTDKVKPTNTHDTNELRWFTKEELDKIKGEMYHNVYLRCNFALNWVKQHAN